MHDKQMRVDTGDDLAGDAGVLVGGQGGAVNT